MKIVIYEVFIGRYRSPLVVVDVHLLAGAVVNAAKDVNVVVEVAPAVEETCEGHRGKLDKLEGLHVQDHCILGTC